MTPEDKELERKLRWIFEAYGKDLQAFFRDAYAAGLNVRPASPIYSYYCLKCGEGHSKAVAYCLMPDCNGRMGDRRDALPAALKARLSTEQEKPLFKVEQVDVNTWLAELNADMDERIARMRPQQQEGEGK